MNCPRCRKEMHRNGHMKDGRQRWICPKGHSMIRKEDYSPRMKRMLNWWNS